MNADPDVIVVGDPLPCLASVRAVHGHAVAVAWAEGPRAGIVEEVDLGPVILQYRIFAPLRADPERFAAVRLNADGDVLLWDEGGIEMAATTVERLAQLAEVDRMTAAAFRAWVERHGFTYDGAAEALGIARRLVAYYLSGEKPIPRTVALACSGYDVVTRDAV